MSSEPELAFFTNKELIDELVKRDNFIGLIIYPREEVKDFDKFFAKTAKFGVVKKGIKRPHLDRILRAASNSFEE